MKAKPNDMQAEQQEQPASRLPVHTKARAPAVSDRPQRISRKIADALHKIVWEGQDIADAARAAGTHPIHLRKALAKPHVIKALRDERDVFIAYARAGNSHDLLSIRRNSKNDNARVAAAKVLEGLTDDVAGGSAQAAPGIVIVIGDIAKALNSPAQTLDLQANVQKSTPLLRELDGQERDK